MSGALVGVSGCVQTKSQIKRRKMIFRNEMIGAQTTIKYEGTRWDQTYERISVDIRFYDENGEIVLSPDKSPIVLVERGETEDAYLWYECMGEEPIGFRAELSQTSSETNQEIIIECDDDRE